MAQQPRKNDKPWLDDPITTANPTSVIARDRPWLNDPLEPASAPPTPPGQRTFTSSAPQPTIKDGWDALRFPTAAVSGLAAGVNDLGFGVGERVTGYAEQGVNAVLRAFGLPEQTWNKGNYDKLRSANEQTYGAKPGDSFVVQSANEIGRGLAPMGAQLALPAGPVLAPSLAAMQAYDRTKQQLIADGMTPADAEKAASRAAAGAGVGYALAPAVPGNVWVRGLTGAGIGAGSDIATTFAVRDAVEQSNTNGQYNAIVDQMDPLDPRRWGVSAGVGAIVGALTGGRGARPRPVSEAAPATAPAPEAPAIPAQASAPAPQPAQRPTPARAPDRFQYTNKSGGTSFFETVEQPDGSTKYRRVNEDGSPWKNAKGQTSTLAALPSGARRVGGEEPQPPQPFRPGLSAEERDAYSRTQEGTLPPEGPTFADMSDLPPPGVPPLNPRPDPGNIGPRSYYDPTIDQNFDPRTPPRDTYGDTQPRRPGYAQFDADEPAPRFGQRFPGAEPLTADGYPNVRESAMPADDGQVDYSRSLDVLQAQAERLPPGERRDRALAAINEARRALEPGPEPAPARKSEPFFADRAQRRSFELNRSPNSGPPAASGGQSRGARVSAPIPPEGYDSRNTPLGRRPDSGLSGENPSIEELERVLTRDDMAPTGQRMPREQRAQLEAELDDRYRAAEKDRGNLSSVPLRDEKDVPPGEVLSRAGADPRNSDEASVASWREQQAADHARTLSADDRLRAAKQAAEARGETVPPEKEPLAPSSRSVVEAAYRRYSGKDWTPESPRTPVEGLRGLEPVEPPPKQNVKDGTDRNEMVRRQVQQADKLRATLDDLRRKGAPIDQVKKVENQLARVEAAIRKNTGADGGSNVNGPFDKPTLGAGAPLTPKTIRWLITGATDSPRDRLRSFAHKTADVGLDDARAIEILRGSELGKAFARKSDDWLRAKFAEERYNRPGVEDDGRGGPKPAVGSYDRGLMDHFNRLSAQEKMDRTEAPKPRATAKRRIDKGGDAAARERVLIPDRSAQDAEAERIEAEGRLQATLQKVRVKIQEYEMKGRLIPMEAEDLARLERQRDTLEAKLAGEPIEPPAREPNTPPGRDLKEILAERAARVAARQAEKRNAIQERATARAADRAEKRAQIEEAARKREEARAAAQAEKRAQIEEAALKREEARAAAKPAPKPDQTGTLPTKRELFDAWAKRNPEKARALVDLQNEAARTVGEQKRLNDLRKERQDWADEALARARGNKLNAFPGGPLDEITRMVRNFLDDTEGAVPPTKKQGRDFIAAVGKWVKDETAKDPMRARFWADVASGAKRITPKNFLEATTNLYSFLTNASVGQLNQLARRHFDLGNKVTPEWAARMGIKPGENPIEFAARLVGTDPGSGKLQGQNFANRAKQLASIWMNDIAPAVNDLDVVTSRRIVELAVDGKLWSRMPVANRRTAPPGVNAAEWAKAVKLRDWFDKVWQYGTDAGLKLGKRENYFPRVLDEDFVRNNRALFIKQATKAYEASGLDATEAANAARDWYMAAAFPGTRGLMNPALVFDVGASAMKKRVLAAAADEHLKDFYVRDAAALTARYAERMAHEVAYTERFGAKGERLVEMNKFFAEHLPEADARLVGNQIAASIGQLTGSPLHPAVRNVLAVTDLMSMVTLLGRTNILQALEPFNIGIRANKDPISSAFMVLDQVRFFANWKPGAKDMKALSDMIGVTGAYARDMLVSSRLDGIDSAIARRLGAMYMDTIGITKLTEGQRSYAVQIGDTMFRHAVDDVVTKSSTKAASLDVLREYGFSEADIPKLKKFLDDIANKPADVRNSAIADPQSPIAEKYRAALFDFGIKSIQEPDPSQLPYLAKAPMARQAYALSGFMYAYTREIRNRAVVMAKRAMTQKGLTPAERAKLFNPLLTYAVVGFGAAAAVNNLMETVFGAREQEQEADQQLVSNLDRMSAFGTFSPMMNMFLFNTRYARDPTTLQVGAYRAAQFKNIADIAGALPFNDRNSENTNSAEWKAARAGYRIGVAPAIALGWSAVPVAPVRAVGAVGIPALTSSKAAASFADATVGPRDTGRPKKNFEPGDVYDYQPPEYDYTPP